MIPPFTAADKNANIQGRFGTANEQFRQQQEAGGKPTTSYENIRGP